ncbi:MAG: right-handed parallel beta-helix repeat-containing protein [Desulfobacterales bacterium]|nr:right-handed parallel beta-helix repeat-containing protein [Desulfobacterales bacterium]
MDAGYDACTFVAAPLNVPGDYETIQAAIAAAQPGNTVLVASGTYDETIIMKPGVSLQGAGADETTIAGAGIYVILCEVSDCKIDGFTIKGSQYGIWNVGSSPTITNNTITGNNDSGIYNKDSSLSTITNNIITGNRKGIENNGASPNISYNDVWGNTTNYYGCSAGPHDTSANPLFVEAGYWDNGGTPEDPSDDFWVEGDYHLQAGSDCIDAGWNDAPDLPGTDFDGNPRIVDGDGDEMAVVDMGAFEYQVAESNHPPVADAGSDQTLEQQTYEGTKVTLNGSGSADPDSTQGTNDDIVSFEWYDGDTLLGTGQAIEHTFPLGSHTVTLVVTDNFGETDEDEIVIIVQDTTVPDIEITYPSDGAKVFMDEEIGVEYSVSDNCDPNPTVTVSPEDLSPPLPIGELTITVTATDAYGNEASDSVTVNVLGPAGIKGDAVSELERVNTGCWRVDRVIDKVITFINKSLEEEYWVDDLHLDAKRGGKVFTYGNLAVGDMKLHIKLWEKRGPTPAQQEAIDAFEAVIPKLLKADKLLAETAIDEAKNTTDPWNPGKSRAYNRFLTKGDKDFEKALSYMDKDRPGLAIVAFKRAWKFAQQAMRLAQ